MSKKQNELVLHFYKQQQKAQETKPKSYSMWTDSNQILWAPSFFKILKELKRSNNRKQTHISLHYLKTSFASNTHNILWKQKRISLQTGIWSALLKCRPIILWFSRITSVRWALQLLEILIMQNNKCHSEKSLQSSYAGSSAYVHSCCHKHVTNPSWYQ